MLVYQRVYLNISQLNAILRTSCSSPVLRTHLEACTPGPSRTPALSTKWKSRQTASWSWWKNYKKKFIWIKWIRQFAYHSFNNYLVVINGDLIYQYPQKILIKWMYFNWEYYWEYPFYPYYKFVHWEFQGPKLEVPTIYKAYFSGLREYPQKIWSKIW